MSRENVEVVRGTYENLAKGDMPAFIELLDRGVEWREAESHPYCAGNPYVGLDSIMDGIFSRLRDEWEGFAAVPCEFLDAGDTIVVFGRYTGTFKETRRPLDAEFAHVYRLRDGKITGMQQYTDTAQFARVTETQTDPTFGIG